jgi:DNA-binding transcriptional LysR family regulator
MNLSFEVLRALDAIDRTSTFAGAAETLRKVPSSLTYLVQKLELDLGVKLFDQRRGGSRTAGNPSCTSRSTTSSHSNETQNPT